MVFFIFCPSAIYKPFFWQPENRLITICCVSPTSSKQSLWQNLFLGSETHQTWENYLLLDFSGYTRGHKELHEDNLYTYVPNLNISGYIYIERVPIKANHQWHQTIQQTEAHVENTRNTPGTVTSMVFHWPSVSRRVAVSASDWAPTTYNTY
jgi:hypothetical protein